MKNRMRAMWWAVLAAALLLNGCTPMQAPGGPAPVEDHSAGAQGAAGAEGAGAQAGGAQMGGQFAGNPLDNPASPLSKRTIYFAFDSSAIDPDYLPILKAHADYLAQHPQMSVVLEGHTDERGSREYNLALGERRANAVEQYLLLQGVAKKQMQVISFGEEHPVALGHDESAWRLNRRVEILYSGT